MLCVIQDRTSRMLIGAGEQHGGLYYYYGSIMATAHQATCRSSLDLWHKRLGHPSTKVLNKLPHLSSNVSTFTESKVCDVCVRAKNILELNFLSVPIKLCILLILLTVTYGDLIVHLLHVVPVIF